MSNTKQHKGNSPQKQESGGWEKRLQQIFLKPWTSEKIKSFISTELQEAERRGIEKAVIEIEAYIIEIHDCDKGGCKELEAICDNLNKLLKKV